MYITITFYGLETELVEVTDPNINCDDCRSLGVISDISAYPIVWIEGMGYLCQDHLNDFLAATNLY
jgi:hypothetical protein